MIDTLLQICPVCDRQWFNLFGDGNPVCTACIRDLGVSRDTAVTVDDGCIVIDYDDSADGLNAFIDDVLEDAASKPQNGRRAKEGSKNA